MNLQITNKKKKNFTVFFLYKFIKVTPEPYQSIKIVKLKYVILKRINNITKFKIFY